MQQYQHISNKLGGRSDCQLSRNQLGDGMMQQCIPRSGVQWIKKQALVTCKTSKNEDILSGKLPPDWQFGFQINERYLKWSESASLKLVKLVIQKKLGMTDDEVNQSIDIITTLLPDIVGKLDRIKADLLLSLIQATPELPNKLASLKSIFPEANVSSLVAQYPDIVLKFSPEYIQSQMNNLRQAVGPKVNLTQLIIREPRIISVQDLQGVLERIKATMPKGSDPVQFFVQNPDLALDMQQKDMPTSNEF